MKTDPHELSTDPHMMKQTTSKHSWRPGAFLLAVVAVLSAAGCKPGDTASGGVTKLARLETGLEIRVPLFIKEGERVKVHTETREFAGRAS